MALGAVGALKIAIWVHGVDPEMTVSWPEPRDPLCENILFGRRCLPCATEWADWIAPSFGSLCQDVVSVRVRAVNPFRLAVSSA